MVVKKNALCSSYDCDTWCLIKNNKTNKNRKQSKTTKQKNKLMCKAVKWLNLWNKNSDSQKKHSNRLRVNQ